MCRHWGIEYTDRDDPGGRSLVTPWRTRFELYPPTDDLKGLLRHLTGDDVVVWSGGSEPGSEINPIAVEAMAELGIDITGEFPKPWTEEIVRAADVVITMGCRAHVRSTRASVTRTGNSQTRLI